MVMYTLKMDQIVLINIYMKDNQQLIWIVQTLNQLLLICYVLNGFTMLILL